MNCFSDTSVSRRLNSRMSSLVVSLSSPTFTRMRDAGMLCLASVFSTAGFNSVVSSSMVAAKKASLGSMPSGRRLLDSVKKRSTPISTNSLIRVMLYLTETA